MSDSLQETQTANYLSVSYFLCIPGLLIIRHMRSTVPLAEELEALSIKSEIAKQSNLQY